MSLWGKSTTNESKPKYLSDSQYATYRKDECFASLRGWEFIPEKNQLLGTGTLSVANGSTDVTGQSSLFTTESRVGQYLFDVTGTLIGKIKTITSDTAIVLDQAFTGTSITTGKYGITLNKQPELLVAISGLLVNLISGATITKIRWRTKGTGTIGASATFGVVVEFNEPVTIAAGATLLVHNFTDGVTDYTATFSQLDSTKTQASFTFTAPVAAQTLGVQTQTITGTIADALGTDGTPDGVISAEVAADLPQRVTA